jgi:hypothetical protein
LQEQNGEVHENRLLRFHRRWPALLQKNLAPRTDDGGLFAFSGEGVEDALRAVLKAIAKSRREEEKEKEEAWRP